MLNSGEVLTIEAEGFFKEPVEKGSKVHLQVKYGLIRLINTEADLCDELESNTDLKCPLEGYQKFTKQVEIPKEVPPVSLINSIQFMSHWSFDS